MDYVNNLFDGRRETSSGVLVFAAEFDSGVLDLSMDEGLDIFDGCCQTGGAVSSWISRRSSGNFARVSLTSVRRVARVVSLVSL